MSYMILLGLGTVLSRFDCQKSCLLPNVPMTTANTVKSSNLIATDRCAV